MSENKEIIASKERMQNDHDEFLEKMKQKFEVEMRTSKFSEENKKLLDELNKRKSNLTEMDDDEVDLTENSNEIIEGLKADIRRLEKSNERDNNMFFKHTQIFDHKLERETKAKQES